jgi:hypothetical protein
MTGLRKGELVSLTRESFALDDPQPIVTVGAGASKHRLKDVLPLHPELVDLLRDWLPTTGPLFPRLGKRKTWLMVKRDLALAGIPYKTAAGIAAFHTAGRNTHITELLRNGASVPAAKELARHSDVKITMRYTHLGIQDQANALQHLPCQHIVSISAVTACQQPPLVVATDPSENETTLGDSEGCDASCHSLALGDRMEAAGIEPAGRITQTSYRSGHPSRHIKLGRARAARRRLILSVYDGV